MARTHFMALAFLAVLSMFLAEPVKAATGDPLTDIAALKASVQAYPMSTAQHNLLTQTLDLATTRVNQNQHAAAKQILGQFKNYVQNYMNQGIVDATTGQAWKDEASAIIAEL